MVIMSSPWKKSITASLLLHLAAALLFTAVLPHMVATRPADIYIELAAAAEPPAIPAAPVDAMLADGPTATDNQPTAASTPVDSRSNETATTTASQPLSTSTVQAGTLSAPSFAGTGGSHSAAAASSDSGTAAPAAVIPPAVISKVAAPYPAAARQKGWQGTTVVRIQILADGQPGTLSIAASSGYADLDEAALQALRQWRFSPAKDAATRQPITCYTTIPIAFRLQ